jgi:hypothetical protein
MPRKNKRKFFGGKGNKSKTVKLNEEEREREHKQQQRAETQQLHESDSDENNAGEGEFKLRKSAVHASISSVTNDSSSSSIGHLEYATAPDASVTKMGGTTRWCSEPNLTTNNNNNSAFTRQQRATIQLKVIQFVSDVGQSNAQNIIREEEEEEAGERDEKESKPKEEENLHEERGLQSHAAGAVPKLDHFREDEANEPQQRQRFDDNYRVESPKQISFSSHDHDGDENRNRLKRHAMLIQEISESSSSEEVKQFLDNGACAIEMKVIEKSELSREYRVESPVSSDECTKASQSDDNLAVSVQEICESSSSESVKNTEQQVVVVTKEEEEGAPKIATLNLKIINIQELPSEGNNSNKSTTAATTSLASPKAKIKLFECKSEKKLNKAEEAIIEALYGNSNLLQIPNTPLDVISEEGSDYNSDIERQHTEQSKAHNKTSHKTTAIHDYDDEDDDDVFLSSTTTITSASRYRNRAQPKRIAEEPLLINTKLIESEGNVQESCKKWETKLSDSELQAELVFLSTSSSATDLSERSSDTEELAEEDTSEDTETNSLLDNISVPPFPFNVTTIQTSAESELESYYHHEIKLLPDILEEDEEQPRSIIESQQQIEDVNKELHHLLNFAVEQRAANVSNVSKDKTPEKRERGEEEEAEVIHETTTAVIAAHDDDDKKLIGAKSETPTPTQFRRKYSSDSSTSSSNSQCTIIRQIMPIENVHALKDLCMRSLHDDNRVIVQRKLNSHSRNAPNIPIINELELHYERDNGDLQGREKDKVITILQVPPEINNNQSNYSNSSSGSSRSGSEEKKRWYGMQSSLPNLMVALSPSQKDYMMSSQDSNNNNNNSSATSADVLLDMHKKFVERRAYHEKSDNDDSANEDESTSRIVNTLRIERSPSERQSTDDSNQSNNGCSQSLSDESAIVKLSIVESGFDNVASGNSSCSLVSNDNNHNNKRRDNNSAASSSENKSSLSPERRRSSAESDTINMNTIRNLILREKFFNVGNNEAASAAPTTTVTTTKTMSNEFKVNNVYELENELMLLDYERKELEEELRNIQSLQHFKREEFLYNQAKIQKKEEEEASVETKSSSSNDNERQTIENEPLSVVANSLANKYVNDDFNDFINSNEKLHKEIYNEWQDKVLERNERKLQKTLKITSTQDELLQQATPPPLFRRERAASERIIKLNDEFLARVKERQKRLSLPLDDNLDASTESLLNDEPDSANGGGGATRKKKKKIFHFDNKENFPAHFREFIEYCEQEIEVSKNSVESGESMIKRNPLLLGLIGVSMCVFGFYIGRHFITKKFS